MPFTDRGCCGGRIRRGRPRAVHGRVQAGHITSLVETSAPAAAVKGAPAPAGKIVGARRRFWDSTDGTMTGHAVTTERS